MGKTKIEWATDSWNPIRARWFELQNDGSGKERIGWHCEKVSAGCRGCYAESFNERLGTGLPYKPDHLRREIRIPPNDPYGTREWRGDVTVFLDERMLLQPLGWRRPRMIFVGSMTDIFADFITDAMLDRIFAVMALCPQHTFQVLTKRPSRMRAYLSEVSATWCDRNAVRPGSDRIHEAALSIKGVDWLPETPGCWPLPNVWIGVSAEDQAAADARIPDLLATPAAVRFVSAEPLLGPLCFRWLSGIDYRERQARAETLNEYDGLRALDWIIVGGESGPGARPMHPDWTRSIRDQCAAAGVPFFFKQWGEWLPWHQFEGTGIDDDAEQTRFRTSELEDGRWRDAGFPMWFDISDGHVDDEHCVARVGKRRAGRLLDGIEHNGMPCREHAHD